MELGGLKFQHEKLPISNFQGHSVVNYTDEETPYTRIHEHKHYEFGTQPYTYITYEYPLKTNNPKEPIYPINNDLNQKIYKKYREKADNLENIHFGGRLAEYRYYDMHQIIGSALSKIDKWTV